MPAATLTGMAMELQTLAEPASLPPGLTISTVKDGESLETWCQLMTSVSEFPDFAAEAWLDMYRGMEIVDDPLWRLYLGSFQGKPVSTSALFLGAGVAGIHGDDLSASAGCPRAGLPDGRPLFPQRWRSTSTER